MRDACASRLPARPCPAQIAARAAVSPAAFVLGCAAGEVAMKRHLHWITLSLFIFCLLYDIVVWGALPLFPDIGPLIVESAQREAPLATSYIWLGRGVDGV